MKPGLCPDFPVIPSDWLASMGISLMSPAEEGAYWRLLCHAWGKPNCCLPDDDGALAVLSRLGAEWQTGSGTKIRQCFVPDPNRPGFIYNERQRATRVAQDARRKAARKKGINAAKARWGEQNSDHAPSIPQALPEHSSSTADASSMHMHGNASSPVSRPPSPLPPIVPQESGGGQTARPLTTAERIDRREKMGVLRRKIETLSGDLESRAYRQEHPEKVAELKSLRAELQLLEDSL